MTAITETQRGSPPTALWKALLLTLPAALLSSFYLLRIPMAGQVRPLDLISAIIFAVVFTAFFFLMVYTGKTHRYRSILFIILAVALPFHFIPMMFEQYGSNILSAAQSYSGNAPFCPLTMPMVLLPAILKGVVIFPGQLAMGATWFLLWVGFSLSLGRGWCSWGCFYGGYDEFFSRLRKKATIKHVDRKWTFLSFGILLAIVLVSAVIFRPFYCQWLCPFKFVTEFEAPTTVAAIAAMVIFIALFLGLVVTLPLLTKKRIQCAIWCPFGALQSLFNKINIFEVRIDPAKCNQCKRCLRECPTLSLEESSLESGKARITCTKCGKCVDVCPQGAMSYHIKGTPVGVKPQTARLLFMYTAWIVVGVLGGNVVIDGLRRILQWITTGSMMIGS
jgi:ferredoxin-type protein NapH